MTRLALAAAAVFAAGCMMHGSGEQELRTRVPGTWTGSAPDGTELTMLLKPDGSGEVNGHPGTWQIKVGRILLSDGEHLVPCDLSGDELTCHTPEGDLVLTRADVREAVTATRPPEAEAASAPPKAFVPEKTVPGQPFIAPANGPIGGASFTTPDGWNHSSAKVAGQDVHVLVPKASGVAGPVITIGRIAGTDLPEREALAKAIAEQTAGQHQMMLEPEAIEFAGRRGARAILTHDVFEYYAAVVRGKDVIFVIVGRYPADQAEAMRPVVETVLGSFRAAP